MGVVSSLRNTAYQLGLMKSTQVEQPVISIGNIIAGGSGKTPLVAWMLQAVHDLGFKPAVIARGYGSANAGEANDEAAMLGGEVYCHPQRRIAAHEAINAGANCLIMDDGFQHRKLARDIDLLCIDATRPWGWERSRFGAFLPYGVLREGPQGARRCDGIILTRFDQAPPYLIDHVTSFAKGRNVPVWRCAHRPTLVREISVDHDNTLDLSNLQQKHCWLVSAIARPQAFAQTVRSTGATIIGESPFPDHYRYTESDLQKLVALSHKHGASLICTEKDAVKLRPLITQMEQPIRLLILEIAIHFINQDEKSLKDWMADRLTNANQPCVSAGQSA